MNSLSERLNNIIAPAGEMAGAMLDADSEIKRLQSIVDEVKRALTIHTETHYSPDGEKFVLIDPEMYDAILEDLGND